MNVEIRFATPKDAMTIAQISRDTFLETFAEINSAENMDLFMNGPFAADRLAAEVGDAANIFLLAFTEGKLAGYAKMSANPLPAELNYASGFELCRLYAKKEAIGKGVGKALMQAFLDRARAGRYAVVWLGVWEDNERAIAFYRSFGFEKFSDHAFVLGNDVQTDWLMKKEMDA